MGRTFSQEFKDQIVELHRRGRSFMDLGKEFDLSPTSVANWAKAADRRDARVAAGDVDAGDDKARIVRLERELARKEEELEILGKALAFFARKMEQ
jgi:transposase